MSKKRYLSIVFTIPNYGGNSVYLAHLYKHIVISHCKSIGIQGVSLRNVSVEQNFICFDVEWSADSTSHQTVQHELCDALLYESVLACTDVLKCQRDVLVENERIWNTGRRYIHNFRHYNVSSINELESKMFQTPKVTREGMHEFVDVMRSLPPKYSFWEEPNAVLELQSGRLKDFLHEKIGSTENVEPLPKGTKYVPSRELVEEKLFSKTTLLDLAVEVTISNQEEMLLLRMLHRSLSVDTPNIFKSNRLDISDIECVIEPTYRNNVLLSYSFFCTPNNVDSLSSKFEDLVVATPISTERYTNAKTLVLEELKKEQSSTVGKMQNQLSQWKLFGDKEFMNLDNQLKYVEETTLEDLVNFGQNSSKKLYSCVVSK